MRKRLFITWVTHNSRYSEKMKDLKLKKQEGYFLNDENRILMYNLMSVKLEKEGIKDFTLNILSDHVHLVLGYEENKLSQLIKRIKGAVSFQYSRLKGFSKEGEGVQTKIWARGFSLTYLDNDQHYKKAIEYTLNNHDKHGIKDILQLVNRGF